MGVPSMLGIPMPIAGSLANQPYTYVYSYIGLMFGDGRTLQHTYTQGRTQDFEKGGYK